jgi:hypothetical protein
MPSKIHWQEQPLSFVTFGERGNPGSSLNFPDYSISEFTGQHNQTPFLPAKEIT